jgi:hypothetical protein
MLNALRSAGSVASETIRYAASGQNARSTSVRDGKAGDCVCEW